MLCISSLHAWQIFWSILQNLVPTAATDIGRMCRQLCSTVQPDGYWARDGQLAHHLPLEHIFTLSGLRRAAPTFRIPTHGGNDSRPNFRILKKPVILRNLLMYWFTVFQGFNYEHLLLLQYIQQAGLLGISWRYVLVQHFANSFLPTVFFQYSLWSHFKQLHGLKIN